MTKKKLQVKISYDPNRLSEKILCDIYEKVVSQIKQQTNFNKNNNSLFESEKVIKNQGGVL